MSKSSYIQSASIQARPAPTGDQNDLVHRIYQSLWGNWTNRILTLLSLYLIYLLFYPLIKFSWFDAVWEGKNRTACLGEGTGACWAFIKAKLSQYIYGRYPLDERWRVDLVFYGGLLGLILMLIPKVPFKGWNALFLLLIYPVTAFVLLAGGYFGLTHVETGLWGGLLVTLVVAITGIVLSLPLGVLLALGRRSRLPVVRYVSIGFIEFWRGVPLITVLFMASVMLPLFLPQGVDFDKLVRAMAGVALFASAYMAEVIRGGLQSIPKGQFEGASALGLGYWQTMRFIILPQALKVSIPGIVNSFISLFKDTTLVLIIGLFDLLGMMQQSLSDSNWFAPTVGFTGYIFAAMLFWVFCFAMSRYANWMEHSIDREKKRNS